MNFLEQIIEERGTKHKVFSERLQISNWKWIKLRTNPRILTLEQLTLIAEILNTDIIFLVKKILEDKSKYSI